MNKLISASLIAILTVGVAHATPEYAASVPVEPLSVTANTKVASTSYVQGAYNEAIKAVNKENQRALAAEGDLSTLTTSTKTSLVGAINEIAGTAGSALTAAQITEGTTDGAISVAGTPVSVHGLGSAAYTASTDYATAAQGALAASALQAADVIEGTTNGTINVDGTDVAVHGLGSAAYTASSAYDAAGAATAAENAAKAYADGLASGYATAAQGALADTAVQSVAEGSTNGTIAVDGTDVAVHGLGSAAYTASSAYDAAGAATAAETAAKAYADAKTLDVYTTWNTDTHQPVSLDNPS